MDTGTNIPDSAPAAAAPDVKPKRVPRARPAAINLTPAAVERVKALLDKRGKPSVGIRIGVRTKGCSGLSYTIEYADAKNPLDEVVEDKLQSGFVFRNPNEKGRCGCGESFHV